VWEVGSVRGNWKGNYDREIMVNFVDLLWRDGVRDLLKKDGNNWPDDFDRQKNRSQLVGDIREILANEMSDSMPVAFVENLVQVIGNSGLLELEAEIKALEVSVPAKIGSEEEALRRYQENRHDVEADDPFDFERAELSESMNFLELEAKLRFDRSWVLRDDLRTTREQFSLLQDEKKLKQAVLEDGRFDEWASPFLRSRSLEGWSEVMTAKFEKSNEWKKGSIFHDMAKADPVAAESLIAAMGEDMREEFVFRIANFRLEHFPEKAREMLPQLLEALREDSEKPMRRVYAIERVSRMKLMPQEEEEFRKVIAAEVANPTMLTSDESTGEFALKALNRLKPRREDLEYFWSQPGFLRLQPSEGLTILKRLIPDRAEFQQAAGKYLRLQLSEGTGNVEEIALLALAKDMRALAPLLEKSATEHSGIPDGRGYEMKKGDRFHVSRYVVALWKEKDRETLAKMWIEFMAGHLVRIYEEDSTIKHLKKRTREAVQFLDPKVRVRWVEEALSHHNFRNREKSERWLRSLK